MPPFLKPLVSFLLSPPLYDFRWLFIGLIFGCYCVALLLVHALPQRATIIYRCRMAWGLAFLMHALVSIAFSLHWYSCSRMLLDFGRYVGFYLAIIGFDLMLGLGLVTAARRFAKYRDLNS